MSITITRPLPNSSVTSPFPVDGTYDLGASLAPSATSPGTIVVRVYQNDGTTPLPNTTVNPPVLDLPSGVSKGKWNVTVTHNGTYNGAVIEATLTPTGGSPDPAIVSGINIT